MSKNNPNNERINREYFAYLKEATRHSEPTVDAAAKSIHRYEVYTKLRDFKTFNTQLIQLKRFFQWLALQPDYKSRLQYSDAEYFNLSEKDTRIATTHREQRVPTLEQIKHVIRTMPASTELEL